MTPEQREQLRGLPSVTDLLASEVVQGWLEEHPRTLVLRSIQEALERLRGQIVQGRFSGRPSEESVLAAAEVGLADRQRPSLRRVINATGVVLHTGLGRAPLCREAVAAVMECTSGYANLELDLATGERGRRVAHINSLLCDLTGAEAATVVNNNAAATLLILNTIAKGREVVVSRGQLVEIGGSYRLPEMMAASGAVLREVGATNRTRITDYERAIGDNTAVLLRVHPSNYKVIGFTESTPIEALVELGRRCRLVVVDDLGSGALFDLTEYGMPAEPDARSSVAAGVDLVCFSGDKLLGGPQSGIILGRQDLVRQIETNPLMRTYRVGKMTLAALEATLRQYRDRSHAMSAVPSLAMLTCPPAELQRRARKLVGLLRKRVRWESFAVTADQSVVGGGSMPGCELPTWCVTWKPSAMAVEEALARLRQAGPPVIARTRDERVWFDLRTVPDDDVAALAEAVAAVVGG